MCVYVFISNRKFGVPNNKTVVCQMEVEVVVPYTSSNTKKNKDEKKAKMKCQVE